MDQDSTSTECQIFPSIDNVFQVLEHQQVCVKNLSYNSWDNFMNYDEIYIVANSNKL